MAATARSTDSAQHATGQMDSGRCCLCDRPLDKKRLWRCPPMDCSSCHYYDDYFNYMLDHYFESYLGSDRNTEDLRLSNSQDRDDETTVLEYVKKHRLNLYFASDRLKKDQQFLLKAEGLIHWSNDHNFSALAVAPIPLRNDKEFVISILKVRGHSLRFASEMLRDDRDVVMAAVEAWGHDLKYASDRHRDDKEIAMAAMKNNGYELLWVSDRLKDDTDLVLHLLNGKFGVGFEHASERLRGDKDVVMKAVARCGHHLQYTSLNDDKDIVMTAVRQFGAALKYASVRLQGDPEVVKVAVDHRINEFELKDSPDHITNNKEVMMTAVNRNGLALEHASQRLKGDFDLVLKAVCKAGSSLKHASADLQGNKTVVMAAVENDGSALEYVSNDLREDKEVVMRSVHRNVLAFRYASEKLKADREVYTTLVKHGAIAGLVFRYASPEMLDDKDAVLAVLEKKGHEHDCLSFVSPRLRRDKAVVLTAVQHHGSALKYALGGLNQDSDCLIAAGVWDQHYLKKKEEKERRDVGGERRIALSTRFSLGEHCTSTATEFAKLLKTHGYFCDPENRMTVYFPNAFTKSTCDPDWVNAKWPCRGTKRTCRKIVLESGVPKEKQCCWRYSFRYQLELAKRTNGFMLQVVEYRDVSTKDEKFPVWKHVLGEGQHIERQMALEVGVKVFVVFQTVYGRTLKFQSYGEQPTKFSIPSIDILADQVAKWYDDDCQDMTTCRLGLITTGFGLHDKSFIWDECPGVTDDLRRYPET